MTTKIDAWTTLSPVGKMLQMIWLEAGRGSERRGARRLLAIYHRKFRREFGWAPGES